ncbi:fibronectin type III domain-containing protein [Granulicella arctica]|uniref:Fibronectin type-III domain-containing protein n=1 Tax=Granulicella arctica TaxID=940613 RepID=A0A7Y9TGZ4_9BACT|nr:fibronectin type III domain-containing protein [Granulicella arctica]NYF80004.1 hypothetical protein [Granulicella arctica]
MLVSSVMVMGLCCGAMAQGTKLWSVDRYDDLAKGSSDGVAIRSDGRLEAGPATSLLYTTGGSYVWSVAVDAAGDGYAGLGGTTSGSAVVMKIAPDGKAAKVFEGTEFGVQALRVLADGSVLAATSPDGKMYRVSADGGAATVLFDPATTEEKPKYLWDVATIGDNVFVATGAPAVVYRVPKGGGKAEVLFRTTDQHIRCLLATADGMLWAGSDGSGVIYRIATMQPGAKPFAVYAATKREITALAADAAGNIYAAGVGAKGASSLPPLPVTGNVGVSITFVQAGSAAAASTNTVVPDGSEIYKIAADGAPSKLLALKDDVVYALAVRNGALLAATGNRGRVYRVDTAMPGRFTDVAHLEATEGMAFAAVKDGLLVATSNSGKVFKMRDRVTSPAIYTSAVFDAQAFSQWGRAEVRSSSPAAFDLYARSGNVESPLMGWSEWMKVAPDAASVGVPAARFVQWKAVLREGATVDSVGLNYLQANAAPVVDEIVVQPGARVAATVGAQANTTVQVSFVAPTASSVPMFNVTPDTGPLAAQKDKTAMTVRWSAHDDNGDDLVYAVYYKGAGEVNWRLLKDKVSDKFLSFDASLLPDGSYTLKVVASDAPVHTDAMALTGDKVSEEFVVDTTPPVPGALVAEMQGNKIHARLEARDATSPIAHAEYSVDAGPWQYVEPAGKISDSLTEQYDFLAEISHVTGSVTDTKEHVIAVRVYDRYENVVAVKAVVRQ